MIWSALHGDMQLTQGQNISSRGDEGKKARAMFVARPGMSLVVADYSMMELRMAAHYSQDEAMTKAFNNHQDLHTLTAASNVGVSYEEMAARIASGDKEAADQRRVAKTENFGLLYGMRPPKFRTYLRVETGIQIDHNESERFVKGFDDLYHGMRTWQGKVVRWVHKHGYVRTIYGRKRRLPEIWSNDRYKVMRAERQAVNAIIQGSCADIMLEVIPAVQQALRPLGGYVLLQIHDEIAAEVPEQYSQIACVIVQELMTAFANQILRVPMVVTAQSGSNWGEAK